VATSGILSLRASESKAIVILIDYKPLWIVIVLILILIALLYYYLRPAIRISKNVFKVKKDKDGNILSAKWGSGTYSLEKTFLEKFKKGLLLSS